MAGLVGAPVRCGWSALAESAGMVASAPAEQVKKQFPPRGTAPHRFLGFTESGAAGSFLAPFPEVNVIDEGAPIDGSTDALPAFQRAITKAAGGKIVVPYLPAGYVFSDGLTIGGAGRAKWIEGDAYVKLLFDNLPSTTDGVTLLMDQFAKISGVEIDLGNATAAATVYNKGRDGLRVKAGDWLALDLKISNCGRDGFHYEPAANYDWLENLVAHKLLVDNCGRDGVHLHVAAGLDEVFANELHFENLEVRGSKRHPIHGVQANITYAAAKIANVIVGKSNFDFRRDPTYLDGKAFVYFEHTSGATTEFPTWQFVNGGWENTGGSLTDTHAIDGDAGADIQGISVGPGILVVNLAAPSPNAPRDRIINWSLENAAKPFGYIQDTVLGFTNIPGAVRFSGNPSAGFNFSGSNLTGDGTQCPLVSGQGTLTEEFDVGSWLSSGVFTAPVAGVYDFGASVWLGDMTSSHTFAALTFTLNNFTTQYDVSSNNPWATKDSNTRSSVSGSMRILLAKGDTIQALVRVEGGTKVVDVANTGQAKTRVWGRLVG